MEVKDLHNILEGKFNLVCKSVGVLLHDTGFMRYKKLTPENYNFWWCEVEDVSKINKHNFTYEWTDMVLTIKFDLLKVLLPFHKPNEDIHKILNNALHIISAQQDGINTSTGVPCVWEVINMYYGGKQRPKQQPKQLTLF